MGQKAITIYTPSSAAPHISAEDDAFIYHSIFGRKSGILGSLTCTKVNSTTIRLSGGGVTYNGRILRIPTGETLDFTIVSGSINRVVAEFTAGGGDTADSYQIKVIQSAVASNQFELFRVAADGTISQVADNLPRSTARMYYGAGDPSASLGVNGDVYFKIVN